MIGSSFYASQCVCMQKKLLVIFHYNLEEISRRFLTTNDRLFIFDPSLNE